MPNAARNSAPLLVHHRGRFQFGLLCLLAYVVLSWAVRLDLRLGDQITSVLYPLDTFSMYARMPDRRTSHLLVRDSRGNVHRVTDFRSFECREPLGGPAAACANDPGIPYLREDFIRHIQAHPGRGGEEAELINRSWEIRAGHPPRHSSDCIVAHCRVSP